MKRFLMIFLLLCMVFVLSACGGKKFTCGLCGEEKKGTQHAGEAYGTEIVLCDDCYNNIKEMVGA